MDMRITNISSAELTRVLKSPQIPYEEKKDIIKNNPEIISNSVQIRMSKSEFAHIINNRPLIRFRPLKNSFTKKGDKKLLAIALQINEPDVNDYIDNIIKTNFENTHAVQKDDIEKVKTYIYRHGRKDQVLAFLKHELSDVKTVLQMLYKTLDDNTGGLCDYFGRPIHLLDNNTMRQMYEIIDTSLDKAQKAGVLGPNECLEASRWAIRRIYDIQSSQKILRAAKIVYNNS